MGHNNLIIKMSERLIKEKISNYANPNIHAIEFSKTLKKVIPNFSNLYFVTLDQVHHEGP